MRNDLSWDSQKKSVRPSDATTLPEHRHCGGDECFDNMAQGEMAPVIEENGRLDWDEELETGAAPRVAKNIYTPTAQEIDEHNATHIPARDWCPACVEGKLANPPHRRTVEEKKGGMCVKWGSIIASYMRPGVMTCSLSWS